jgi:prepilin-type N-terminal cleavage/methylation domain-containing protein
MQCRRSSPTSRHPEPAAGFSLVELLVSVSIAGVALTSMITFFALQTRGSQGHAFRVEAQQALRASLDAITRDVRLAGACLPINTGQYVPLAGTDSVNGDSITIRSGLLRADLSCISAALTPANTTQGTTTLQVDSGSGFTGGMLVYLRHPSGSGMYAFATGAGATTVSIDTGLSQDYPKGSGIYAIDERTYTIDRSVPNTPRLMLAINRGTPMAFAAGINDLQLQYVLDQNCPPCDVVNAPAAGATATWLLVNDVLLTASAQTVGTIRPQDVATLTETSRAKPRNLLP